MATVQASKLTVKVAFPASVRIKAKVLLLGFLCLASCQTRSSDPSLVDSDVTAQDTALPKPFVYDFCRVEGSTPDVYQVGPWSAVMVQTAITHLINQPSVKDTVWSAYPVAYRRMTAARDKERCRGIMMHPDSRINLINHQLSDIMTRWMVLETSQCAAKKIDTMPDTGLCGVMKRSVREKYDGLSEAMASTAVYLSSHLAMSLTALIADDGFWDAFPDQATHRGALSLESVLEKRLAWMTKFKPTFDIFNSFLADNLGTVAQALEAAGLVKGYSLNLGVYMATLIKCKAVLFGSIRDKAFAAALSYARDPLLVRHPMLKQQGGGYRLNYGSFSFDAPVPQAITGIEGFSLAAVANPLSFAVYREILGGTKPDSLPRHDRSGCPL